MKFKDFIREASIAGFMDKIRSCQTVEGLKELETYYSKRVKDVDLKDADDISIRDAIAGRREEIELAAEENEE
ncbi:TPA: UvsW-1 domain-containing protein [Vibrio cholerae]|nr:hypothetical protein [Providencia phage PSTRCR_127]QQV89060.1 hypothetical protein [Providencia phage PSTRCR_121]UGO50233.1 putative RNA-DNA and DNA-DNA helicase [Morganella phage vB_MmoM_Rgz1]